MDSRPATVRPERFSTLNEDKCERLCLQTPNTKEHATEVNFSHLLALFLLPFSHDPSLPATILSITHYFSFSDHSLFVFFCKPSTLSFPMNMQIGLQSRVYPSTIGNTPRTWKRAIDRLTQSVLLCPRYFLRHLRTPTGGVNATRKMALWEILVLEGPSWWLVPISEFL